MNKPFQKIGYIGISAAAVIIVMQTVFAVQAGGFNSAILRFEFAKTPADVLNIFYEGGFDHALIRAVNTANVIDFLFMAVYSIFLLAFVNKIYELNKQKVFLYAIALVPLIFLTDLLENFQMYAIAGKLVDGGFERNILWLRIFTWIKWMSLAVVFVAIAYYWYLKKHALLYICSAVAMLPVLLGLTALFSGNFKYESTFAYSIFLAFGVAIVYSFVYTEEMSAN